MKRTLVQHATVKNAVVGIDVASSKTGVIIDRDGFRDGILHVILDNVTGSPTAVDVTVKLQHSDTDQPADFADVDVQGVTTVTQSLTAAGEETELHINLEGLKRYVRAVVSANLTGGTSPKVNVIGTLVLGNAENLPIA
jgi:hypothetical protein